MTAEAASGALLSLGLSELSVDKVPTSCEGSVALPHDAMCSCLWLWCLECVLVCDENTQLQGAERV